MPDRIRVYLLCEDPAQEDFVAAALGQSPFQSLHLVRRNVGPRGKGAGEAWVKKQYEREVKLFRRQRRERVALLAVVDGDTAGVQRRKEELEAIAPRGDGERIAICVPTRNIETWFRCLAGLTCDEATDYKRSHGSSPSNAASEIAHRLEDCELPSALDDLQEMKRITR